MADDAAAQMKARLREDLVASMKTGKKHETALIRALIAAIDNAEAAPVVDEPASLVHHDFRSGSAETERLSLSETQVRDLILAEIEERDRAATEFERLGKIENAEALRAEALTAKRYIDA